MKRERFTLIGCITACITLSALIVFNALTDSQPGVMRKYFISHLLLMISPWFAGLAVFGCAFMHSNPKLARIGFGTLGIAAAATVLAVRTLLK